MIEEALQRMTDRRDGQKDWLKKKHPEVFQQQKHCDAGTVERAYWHYGYMVALGDALRLLAGKESDLPS